MKHALGIAAITALFAGASRATQIENYTVVANSSSFGAAPSRTIGAVCPDGTLALGGGADTAAGGGATPRIRASGPVYDRSGWYAAGYDPSGEAGWRLSVTAICGVLPGSELANEVVDHQTGSLVGFSYACSVGKRPISGGVQSFGDAEHTGMCRSIALGDSAWYAGIRGYDTGE